MNINEIKMGRFDQKLFDEYKNKLTSQCSKEELEAIDKVEKALKEMGDKSNIWETTPSKSIYSVCDNLKEFSSLRLGRKVVLIVESDLCNLADFIFSQDTKKMVENNVKYKELKSKSKLTKIFIVMFKNMIRGSKYKKWRSELKSLEQKVRERMDKCKLEMKKKTSDNNELAVCFYKACLYMMMSMVLHAVDCIRGTLVSVDDNSLKSEGTATQDEFYVKDRTIKIIKDKNLDASDIKNIDDLFSERDKGKPKYYDISQFKIDDCYLLSALTTLAKVDPLSIRDCFTKVQNGKVTVRFFKVELKLLSSTDSLIKIKCIPKSPVFIEMDLSFLSKSNTVSKAWVKLMEKAYAIYRAKHFDPAKAIARVVSFNFGRDKTLTDTVGWGNSSVVMCAITGHPSEFNFKRAKKPKNKAFSGNYDKKANKLWEDINQSLRNRKGVTVIFKSKPKPLDGSITGITQENIEGIVKMHVYAVLNTFEEGGIRYIEFRNPWGEEHKTSFGYEVSKKSKAKQKNEKSVFCVELNHLMEYLQMIDYGR